MDSDLLTEARALAERGWLPGICADDLDASNGVATFFDAHANVYVLAEPFLHLAAHREIVRRGWTIEIGGDGTIIAHNGWIGAWPVVEPGTATLSLLRCLRRAIEAQERSNGQ